MTGNWHAAMIWCNSKHMRLASFDTASQYVQLTAEMDPLKDYWVGGTDLHSESFAWTADGRDMRVCKDFYLDPNEPFGDVNNHCIQLRHDTGLRLAAEDCSYVSNFACEFNP